MQAAPYAPWGTPPNGQFAPAPQPGPMPTPYPQQPGLQGLWGTVNSLGHLAQGFAQPQAQPPQSPQALAEQEEDALWLDCYRLIYSKSSTQDFRKKLDSVLAFSKKYNCFTWDFLFKFATNANPKGIMPSSSSAPYATPAPYSPTQTPNQAVQPIYITLPEACFFTNNVSLFETLIDWLAGKNSQQAQAIWETLRMVPIDSTGNVPCPPPAQGGIQASISDYNVTPASTPETALTQPEGIRKWLVQQAQFQPTGSAYEGASAPSPASYPSLLHYVFENQRAEMLAALFKLQRLLPVPDQEFQRTLAPILFNTLSFIITNKIKVQDAFWKVLPPQLLKALFAYEARPLIDPATLQPLQMVALAEPILFKAAKAGNLALAKRLIEAGAPFETKFEGKSFLTVLPPPQTSASKIEDADSWRAAPTTKTEDTAILDFGAWLFSSLNKTHLKGEGAAALFLDLLKVLPTGQRGKLLKDLEETEFLRYFVPTLTEAKPAIVAEFLKSVSPAALVSWLPAMEIKSLEALLNKMTEPDLQNLLRALMELPAPAKDSTATAKPKSPKIEGLDVLWRVQNPELQARIMTQIMSLNALDVKSLSAVLTRISPKAIDSFLKLNLAAKPQAASAFASPQTSTAPSREAFLAFLPQITTTSLTIQLISPLLTSKLITPQERETLLAKMPNEALSALVQDTFERDTHDVPESLALLMRDSATPAFVVRLLDTIADLRILENAGDLLHMLSSAMLPKVVELWIRPEGSPSSTAKSAGKPRRAPAQTASKTGQRTTSSASRRGTSASTKGQPKQTAPTVDRDRLNTLLAIQDPELLAHIITILLNLKVLDTEALGQALSDMPDEALTLFLETNLERGQRSPSRDMLLAFLQKGPAELCTQLLTTIARLSQDRLQNQQPPLLDIAEIETTLNQRTDKDLETVVQVLFDTQKNCPPVLETLFSSGTNASLLARLLAPTSNLLEDCGEVLALLQPAMLRKVLEAWIAPSKVATKSSQGTRKGTQRSASSMPTLTASQRQTRLDALLKIQNADLLAQVVTHLLDLNLLDTKELGGTLEKMAAEPFEGFLRMNLARGARSTAHETLQTFLPQAPTVNLSTRLLETILRLRLMEPREFETLLAQTSDEKVKALLKTLFSQNEAEIPEIVYTLFEQSQDPAFTVRLLAAIADLRVLDGEDLGNLLLPLPDERLRRVTEVLLGVTTPSAAPSGRKAKGRTAGTPTDRTALLQQLQTPELIIRLLTLINDELLGRVPQTVLTGFVSTVMKKESEQAVEATLRVLQMLVKTDRGEERFKAVLQAAQGGAKPAIKAQLFTLTDGSGQTLLQSAVANRNAGAVRILLEPSRPKGAQTRIETWQRYFVLLEEAYGQALVEEGLYNAERSKIEEAVKPLIQKQLRLRHTPNEELDAKVEEQWNSFLASGGQGGY